jgi:hypothetical protein
MQEIFRALLLNLNSLNFGLTVDRDNFLFHFESVAKIAGPINPIKVVFIILRTEWQVRNRFLGSYYLKKSYFWV